MLQVFVFCCSFLFFGLFIFVSPVLANYSDQYWNVTAGPSPSFPSGDPAYTSSDSEINFSWGESSPAPGTINIDGFVARWIQTINFVGGTYTFTASVDDGVDIYIDNVSILRSWIDQGTTTYSTTTTVTAGSHEIKVEYYENSGGAVIQFSYSLLNPTLQSFFPADSASTVTTSANLVLTFSETVNVGSGNIVIYKSADDSIFETIAVTSGNVTGSGSASITVNPTGTFAEQTSYYVQIGSGAFIDGSGYNYVGIADTTTWNFTTGDFTAPTVAAKFPTDNATNVTTTSNLILTFSEAVNVSSGNIVIYKSADDSIFETITVTSGNVTGSGSTSITVNPTNALAEQTEYYIKIDATAFTDAANNSYAGIADTTTWNFTIGDFTGPIISGVSPSGEENSDTTGVNLSVNTDENATCKYSETSGAAYVDMAIFTTTGATSHFVRVSGLTAGNTYSYYVLCQDSLSNESVQTTISFSIQAAPQRSAGAAPAPAPAIGFGANTSNIGMNQIGLIGNITDQGTNILSYINSQANFTTKVSSTGLDQTHSFQLSNLDLIKKTITVTFQSKPTLVSLSKGEIKPVDLDQDGINDIEVTFTDLLVNRVEITAKNILTNNPISPTKEKINISLPTNINFNFTKNLSLGTKHNEVKELQKYLNNNGYLIAQTGPGSIGNETTYFGQLTKQALIKFQKDKNLPAYGLFGVMTRKVINQ